MRGVGLEYHMSLIKVMVCFAQINGHDGTPTHNNHHHHIRDPLALSPSHRAHSAQALARPSAEAPVAFFLDAEEALMQAHAREMNMAAAMSHKQRQVLKYGE